MKLSLVETDDWEALYIDGKCIEQGHSIGEGEGVDYWFKLGQKYPDTKLNSYYIDMEHYEDEGCFPDNFDEIPLDWLESIEEE
jgi:hypothetical protein